MITNRDIEIAFVRAQNRINEQFERAQAELMMPDMEMVADVMTPMLKRQPSAPRGQTNPLTNEEI